ncbi:MAG: hypothetical protein M3N33_09755 [Actinomycetota bacterium]|nr:hypothetical protein [Actinomycetota bacterium]
MIQAKTERPAARKAILALGILLAALVAAWSLLAAGPAHGRPLLGNTFTVTTTVDLADADLADSVCDVNLFTEGNQCSLRAAMEEANATPNDTFEGEIFNDLTKFDIAGTGVVKTIRPSSELPNITEAVTIEGYTQPGARPQSLDAASVRSAASRIVSTSPSNVMPALSAARG